MELREFEAGRPVGYLPIRDYALIGDCHGSALVGRDGSIDWCCLGRFDADPVFCRMLDRSRGGFLSVTPLAEYSVSRAYLDGTNVLETIFRTAAGEVAVTDFMPVGRQPGSGTHNYVDLAAPHWLVRTLTARHGRTDLRIDYRPSILFGRSRTRLITEEDGISCEEGPYLTHNIAGFTVTDDLARATISLRPGETLLMVLSAQRERAATLPARIDSYRSATIAFWREWIAYCRYRGRYAEQVKRSLLTIKLLIYAPSGAVAAAPTTSLPEDLGGSRNWDYRYCWLRDASFAFYALAVTGYGGEARRFSAFLGRACAATTPDLNIMYGIEAETDLDEKCLDHLDGYQNSRPVRTGNAAFRQRQLDVYGEVLDWALLLDALGGQLDEDARQTLAVLADYVADHWHEPEHGIWEIRGPPTHHVHGKIMSWVALDRATRLLGSQQHWEQERQSIISDVAEHGCAAADAHLVQAYGRKNLDAALLLTPMTGFPIGEDLLRNTIAAIERELGRGDFLYRYRTDDGIEGGEGAFLICSFWLVDAYLCAGRHREARELYEALLSHSNDLGLYSEEIDPRSYAFLGNFPQAYTHLALIGSAAHLQLCEQYGAGAIRGTNADRARRMVTATLGWRGLWAAFKATWKVGRLRSSRDSMLILSD